MTRPPTTRRTGFTLIELLVVIAIIGILIALLLPAVQQIRAFGPRTDTVNQVNQLSASCDSFHREFQFYPPTAFRVPLKVDSTDPNYLLYRQMYPRWTPKVAPAGTMDAPDGTPLANTTDGKPAFAGDTLVGNQCMVYFLGGPNNTGWRDDRPYAPPSVTTPGTKGPYFDFKANKLLVPSAPTPALTISLTTSSGTTTASAAAPVYLDPYDAPFMYFGSLSTSRGGYPAAAVTYSTVSGSVSPFIEPGTGKPVNRETCQIVSAGKNAKALNGPKGFGPGGNLWTPGTTPYSEKDAGFDDLANFNDKSQLGVSGK